ncbi:extracellular phospholipase C [Phlegmacium glaucopus]|nr:extracellular phospholipase C [Phlegmacium glaucopus]
MVPLRTTALVLASAIAVSTAQSNLSNIKNVVVLVQENRSFDWLFGDLSYSTDIDNLRNLGRTYCNPANVSAPTGPQVCAAATAANVSPDDPNHSVTGVNFQIFSTFHPNEALTTAQVEAEETMLGFLQEQEMAFKTTSLTRASESINYISQSLIPVYNTLAQDFVIFDRWFADVPGPTDPNRAYITSGASHGHGKNDNSFSTFGLPQRSIFQQLSENNVTWINYFNSSFNPDAEFYSWTQTQGKVATNVKAIAQFFTDARAGTLPQFSYINPECCSFSSMHPPSPINDGEAWTKSLYEAIRSGPQWNHTLFIITFDEHGGFADHVPPPVGVPNPDGLTYTETAGDGKSYTFNFNRLGVRVPTLLISPWVQKGVIEHNGINNGLTYTHSSIAAFIAKLWNLDNGTPLTPRVGFASSFEHLITNTFRNDPPVTLPNPA